MKLYLQVLLLLISIIIFSTCSSTKGFVKDNSKQTEILPLLPSTYNSVIYNAKIDIGEKHFSGLFYFKALEDSSVRILFLTQFGLSLLDLEYKNKEFTVKKCQEFLNKKIIINTLKKDLQLLIDIPLKDNKKGIYTNQENNTLIKYNKNCRKNYYYISKKNQISKIIQKKRLSHIQVNATNYKKNVPENIIITNKRINLTIKLNLIKTK